MDINFDDIEKSVYSIFYLGFSKFLLCTNPLKAELVYKDKKIDLITGTQESHHHLTSVDEIFPNTPLITDDQFVRVYHLFYEFSEAFESKGENLEEPLYMDIVYQQSRTINVEPMSLSLKVDKIVAPKWEEYKKAFDLGMTELLDGNCYQFNLTFPFRFDFSSQRYNSRFFVKKFLSLEGQLGAYAHLTYIPRRNQLLISNSPECLFQSLKTSHKVKLWSMPIKGSLRCDRENETSNQWSKLRNSKKDEAELFMITDLIKNDIIKINLSKTNVVHKKIPLLVPGIIHQFSLISTNLKLETTLKSVLVALFPGGSITGAPKIRVMDILKQLEARPRGFYCGSTVLSFRGKTSASINIRSGVIDFNQRYLEMGAGGGITLKSYSWDEFLEMKLKAKSFGQLFFGRLSF